ncbi:alkene reductase [Vibrio sp.]|nr:alkene reductase [Vibrio sp.]
MSALLTSYTLNDTLTLKNRIVMAPMTRSLSGEGLVPTEQMAEYYAKRASTGLIVTEGTIIRPDAQGIIDVPGIWNQEQIQAWKKVTDRVHEEGGKIFTQIWHMGRLSHSHFHNERVLAPSAIAYEGNVPRSRELSYEQPDALSIDEIAQLVTDFKQAALNAMEAGFDGVEIHGANGYLLDQFLHHETNQREDEFGGSIENMTRFPLQVLDAVGEAIGFDRTAIRVSPGGYLHLTGQAEDRGVFDHLLKEIEKRDVAYLHLGIFDDSMEFDYLGGKASTYLRENYSKTLIGCGSYDQASAEQAIENAQFDLMGIGRPLIANPDYAGNIRLNKQQQDYDSSMLESLI